MTTTEKKEGPLLGPQKLLHILGYDQLTTGAQFGMEMQTVTAYSAKVQEAVVKNSQFFGKKDFDLEVSYCLHNGAVSAALLQSVVIKLRTLELSGVPWAKLRDFRDEAWLQAEENWRVHKHQIEQNAIRSQLKKRGGK